MCSGVAVRDISDQSLAASLLAFTISSATNSNDVASPCQVDTVGCRCSTAAVNVSDKQTDVDTDADKRGEKTSENSAVDDVASCSRTDINPTKSWYLSSTSNRSSEDGRAVGSMLCLLHGLSHCSYHEPSLLVLAEHAAHDAAADLFVYLWHKLQTSRQQEDKIQARISVFCLYYLNDVRLAFTYLH